MQFQAQRSCAAELRMSAHCVHFRGLLLSGSGRWSTVASCAYTSVGIRRAVGTNHGVTFLFASYQGREQEMY